jgi:hypothetical protein
MRLHLLAPLLVLAAAAIGCQPKVAPACARYVTCQAAWDESQQHTPKDTRPYAEGGACWTDGAAAARCEAECGEALVALHAAAQAAQVDVPCDP